MVVQLIREVKRGVSAGDNGDVHLADIEYGGAVHSYAISSGHLQGDREESGGMGGDVVVLTGGCRLGRGYRVVSGGSGGRGWY